MIIKVENENDSGCGSLRDAISQVNDQSDAMSTITFCHDVKEIKLCSEITVAKNVEIIAKHQVTIYIKDCEQARHFKVTSDAAQTIFKLKNLVLRGGDTSNDNAGGGSICIDSVNPLHKLILEDCSLKHNKAIYGGAILTNANLILIKTSIKRNCATKQAGGCWVGKNVTMINSSIEHNKVTEVSNENFAGGLNVDDGDLSMINSCISNNLVKYDDEADPAVGGLAGGVNVMAGSITANNSHIDCNIALSSGGIKMGTGNINLINKSSVSGNKSFIAGDNCGGGGINIMNGNVIVEDSTIADNKTNGMYSGSIVSFLGNVSVSNSTISNNVNRGPGGGIACNFNSAVSVVNSKMIGNSGSSLGGAIVNFSGFAGQTFVDKSEICDNNLTNYQTIGQTITAFLNVITGVITQSDTMGAQALPSPTGGKTGSQKLRDVLPAIQTLANATNQSLQDLLAVLETLFDVAKASGGTIASILTCPITITDSKINQNYVTKYVTDVNPEFTGHGGAIFAINSKVVVEDSEIKHNHATTSAGAIYNNGDLLITNSKISDNKTKSCGHNPDNVEFNGTIVNTSNGIATIVKSIINYNHVDTNGGGIYNAGDLILIESEINKNKACGSGGGIYSLVNFTNIDSSIKCNKPDDVVITPP